MPLHWQCWQGPPVLRRRAGAGAAEASTHRKGRLPHRLQNSCQATPLPVSITATICSRDGGGGGYARVQGAGRGMAGRRRKAASPKQLPSFYSTTCHASSLPPLDLPGMDLGAARPLGWGKSCRVYTPPAAPEAGCRTLGWMPATCGSSRAAAGQPRWVQCMPGEAGTDFHMTNMHAGEQGQGPLWNIKTSQRAACMRA